MRSAECNGDTQPAGWERKNGEFLFACLGGVVGLQPTQMPRATHPPAVLIEEAKVNGRAASGQTGVVRIPAGDGSLEFTYTAIDFTAPRQVQFRYRLENVDREWVEAGARRAWMGMSPSPSARRNCRRRSSKWFATPIRRPRPRPRHRMIASTGRPPGRAWKETASA